jgi:CheY-like chemotaxis protein
VSRQQKLGFLRRHLRPCRRHVRRGKRLHPNRDSASLQIQANLIPPKPENLDLARILIVDDDAAVQTTIRLLLERAGHHVVGASDGRKGLASLEGEHFDLLFLDIFMPGMDGFETMRMVRQQHPRIPIIVISGRPMPSDGEATPDFLTMATKLGAISSLQKPFKSAQLLAAVNRCLEAGGRGSTSSGQPTVLHPARNAP